MSGKFGVDLKSRHPVPGAGGDLNEPLVVDTRERNLCLYPLCRLPHPAEWADLHPERLVIITERVAKQACDMIRLFNATLRQR